jgi:hypothetical protein
MARKLLAAAVAAAGLALAGSAGASPNLFVGFSDDALKYEPSFAAPIARDLGAQAFRVTLLWQRGQTDLSPVDVADFDRMVAGSGGMRIVVAVYGRSNTDAPTDEASREQYCGFVRNLLARYPEINDVVIWNETNKQFFWKPQFNADGSSAAPAAYAALLARCWDVLHAFRPEVNLIAAATSPRGNDRPLARSNVSHSPGAFIRKLGKAFRELGRTQRFLDTVGHHGYGWNAAERPFKRHGRGTGTISEGDLAELIAALKEAFAGTAQPLPGQCADTGWCVGIWYMEMGYQSLVDDAKRHLYTGRESDDGAVPDDAGAPGWDGEARPVSEASPAPDQSTQIIDSLRLAYCQPFVDAYFNLQLWDEHDLARWQSAPLWYDRTPKDSYGAFRQGIGEVNADAVDCGAVKGPQATKLSRRK